MDIQYYGCWWPSDAMNQGIGSHNIDLIIPAHWHNIDILCLTESWINDNISDLLCLKSATPSGYSFISVPRKSGRGGGLVLIHKSSIRVSLKPSLNNDSFESMLAEVVNDHI